MNLMSASVSAPSLGRLTVSNVEAYDYSGCQVLILGTSPKYLSYTGKNENEICLCSSSSQVEASVTTVFISEHREREVAYRLNKLLSRFSNVKSPTLSGQAVEALTCAEELFVHLLAFHSLTRLEVEPGPVELNCGGLLNILQNCPSIESLICHEIDHLFCISGE